MPHVLRLVAHADEWPKWNLGHRCCQVNLKYLPYFDSDWALTQFDSCLETRPNTVWHELINSPLYHIKKTTICSSPPRNIYLCCSFQFFQSHIFLKHSQHTFTLLMVSCHARHHWSDHWEQSWVQCFGQGHLDTFAGGAGDRNISSMINWQAALPAEPQLLLVFKRIKDLSIQI